jgi:L-lysine exporter family protein LysE/ArgO
LTGVVAPATLRGVLAATLIKGILLGLGAAAPIGPVNVEMARRSIRAGWGAGFLLGCGAVTVDVSYIILLGLGFQPLLRFEWLKIVLGIGGVLFLGYLGIQSLRSARRDYQRGLPEDGQQPVRRSYLTGVAMTSLNPMTLAFWFVVVPTYASDVRTDLPLLALGVLMGTIAWVAFFSTLMSLAGKIARRKALFLADACGGVVLLSFAALTIWRLA